MPVFYLSLNVVGVVYEVGVGGGVCQLILLGASPVATHLMLDCLVIPRAALNWLYYTDLANGCSHHMP